MLGSLPVVASYLERAGIAEIVSAVCPVAAQAILSHGDVIAAMIANRLSAPRPLYRVEEWAEEYAVKECLGIHSHLLNDDRCGEALDALAPKGDEVQTAISLRVAAEFKLEMKQIHVDFTPVVFHGAYEQQDPDFARILLGFPRPSVPKSKKVMGAQVCVTADGAVPLLVQPHSGNQAEVTAVISVFEKLKGIAGPEQFMIIGDSKLLSSENIDAILLGERHFLAPGTDNAKSDAEIRALPEDGWEALNYLSEREAKKRPEDRKAFYCQEKSWDHMVCLDSKGARMPSEVPERLQRFETWVQERQDNLARYRTVDQLQRIIDNRLRRGHLGSEYAVSVQGPGGGRPTGIALSKKYTTLSFSLRKLYVLSEEEREAVRKNRRERMERLEKEVRHLQETVENYPEVTQLHRKVQRLLEDRKLASFHGFEVKGPGEGGKRPTGLTFQRDEKAVARAQELDGIYILWSSASQETHSCHDLMSAYKEQNRLEARHANLKGALAVAPVFLKSNRRAVGLLVVVSLALLIYTLIERDARAALKDDGGMMEGLYPEGRKSRPTTQQILRVFSNVGMSWIRMGNREGWVCDPLSFVQRDLLRMLKVAYPWP